MISIENVCINIFTTSEANTTVAEKIMDLAPINVKNLLFLTIKQINYSFKRFFKKMVYLVRFVNLVLII